MMEALKSVLLVEDNELDVELSLKAFKGNNLANTVQVVQHGNAYGVKPVHFSEFVAATTRLGTF